MQTQVFYLEARSPFHFGERGVGLEATSVVAHADTLFSALCATCRELYGVDTLSTMLAAFQEEPPFLLSSGFPYINTGSGMVRFYPRPLDNPPGADPGDQEVRKQTKKVKWVSENIFKRWISAEAVHDDFKPLHEGEVWVSKEEASAIDETAVLWETGDVPRVTVDRSTSASQIYRAGRVYFAPGNGLWIAFCWLNDGWQPSIEECLHVLSDAGVGGERSAGHGQFKVAGNEWVDMPEPTGRFVTLSPYWPQPEETATALGSGAAYKLLVRRGWMGSPDGSALRRKAVRMVEEGSVLNWAGGRTAGGLAWVTPDVFTVHEVYRYGYAFPVGMEAV